MIPLMRFILARVHVLSELSVLHVGIASAKKFFGGVVNLWIFTTFLWKSVNLWIFHLFNQKLTDQFLTTSLLIGSL